MEEKIFCNIHLQRKSIRSLSAVTKSIRIKETCITINPNQLFHRIVCVAKSESDLSSYLSCGLAARPPSLFNEYSFREGTISSLVPLTETLKPSEKFPPAAAAAVFTLDGGYLLHIFGNALQHSVRFVLSIQILVVCSAEVWGCLCGVRWI